MVVEGERRSLEKVEARPRVVGRWTAVGGEVGRAEVGRVGTADDGADMVDEEAPGC